MDIIKIISLKVLIVVTFLQVVKGVKLYAQNENDFEIVKYNNPDLVVDLAAGLWAYPIPMDVDGDGDMDMLISCTSTPYNGLYYYENISGKEIPVFAPGVRMADGLQNVQVSYVDNKPRILIPEKELRNFPKIAELEEASFDIDASVLKEYASRPRFNANQWRLVDYDSDGDLDIIIGSTDWSDYGWDNAFDKNGNWTKGPLHGYVSLLENINGKYVDRGRIKAGEDFVDVYGSPCPNFADFDGDGDLDLICGDYINKLTYFENIGSETNPEYTHGKYLTNNYGIVEMDLQMIIPVAVDWDKDGDMDLVVGDEDGRVALVQNTGEVINHMPQFEKPYYFKQKADVLKFGGLVTPFGVDWDNDGDEDLICGNSAGYIGLFENLGGSPVKWNGPEYLKSDGEIIRIKAGPNGSIQGPVEQNWGYTTLAVCDWDNDGLKDIVVNSIWGKVEWYKNLGSATKPKLGKKQSVLVDWSNYKPGDKQPYYDQKTYEEINVDYRLEENQAPKPVWTWWEPSKNELATQWRTTPYAIDWNKDGLMDLVMLDHEGYLAFFERFKKGENLFLKPGKRIFYGINGANYNSWNGLINGDKSDGLLRLNATMNGQSGRRKITFVDWDQDGDLDMLTNGLNAVLFENVSSNKNRSKIEFKCKGSVSEQRLAGHTNSPTIIEIHGKPELVVGAEDGHLYLFKKPQ